MTRPCVGIAGLYRRNFLLLRSKVVPKKDKNFPHTVAVQGSIFNSHASFFSHGKVPPSKEEIMNDFCDEKFGPEHTEEVPGIESYQYGEWSKYNYANKPFTFAFRKAEDAVLFKLRFAEWLYQKPSRKRKK
jgi:hypothetical protein